MKRPLPIAPTDKVLIVGAGPAGLHAASRLIERGVRDVHILERQARIGGKALTLHHHGIQYEMGACFLHNDYFELTRLITQLGLRAPVAVPKGSRTLYGSRQRPDGLAGLGLLLVRYVRLHRHLLGAPIGGLYPRPDAKKLEILSMPAIELIQTHGLSGLELMLRRAFAAQGFGYLEDVPAFYMLLWLTPAVVAALVMSTATRPVQKRSKAARDRFALTRVLPDGFGTVFTSLAERCGLRITLGAEVMSVVRRDDTVGVTWKKHGDESDPGADTSEAGMHESEVDWLLWACPMGPSLGVFTDLDEVERSWFADNPSHTFTSTAYRDLSVPGYTADGYTISYFLDEVRPERAGAWHADRNDGAIWPSAEPSRYEHRVAFQLVPVPVDHEDASSASLLARLRADWKASGRLEAAPVMDDRGPIQHRWSFFHHLPAPAVRAGHHWDILDQQGRRRCAFLGASVWFESVEHVLRYNRAVLG